MEGYVYINENFPLVLNGKFFVRDCWNFKINSKKYNIRDSFMNQWFISKQLMP